MARNLSDWKSKSTALEFRGKTAFALGTGRCGTTFLHRVISCESRIASFHMRHGFGDAFHRYCTYNRLPVDSAGYFSIKEEGIRTCLQDNKFYFESNPYLSLSINDLFERFGSYFVLLVRHPEKVINSHVQKGWYVKPFVRSDLSLASGVQEDDSIHSFHFISRIAPMGDEAKIWNNYTQVGKLAWYWRVINEIALEQLSSIPTENQNVCDIDKLTYDRYKVLLKGWGINPTVSAKKYSAIAEEKPNRLFPTSTVHDWTAQECREFESQVAKISDRLQYEWRTDILKKAPKKVDAAPKLLAGRQMIHKFVKRYFL